MRKKNYFMPGVSKTKTYKVWQQMKHRCNNPNNSRYARYGGRGIGYCESWGEFEAFLADMGEAPEGGSLDRINNDSDYSKENCRWATAKQQARNRSNNTLLRVDDVEMTLAEWSEFCSVGHSTFLYRMKVHGLPACLGGAYA